MRLVVSLTTLPGRYESLEQTLLSIQNQTVKADAVYLGLPKIVKRTGEPYPELPQSILGLCKVVELENDYGPICKLVAGLVKEDDEKTVIITIDDDTIYNSRFIETMKEKCYKFPHIAVCANGARFERGPMFVSIIHAPEIAKPWNGIMGFPCDREYGGSVDVAYGMGGVAYRRGFFPKKQNLYDDFISLSQEKYNLFRQDDVMISGYLSKFGIDRRVFLDIPGVTTIAGNKDCITPDLETMMKGVSGAIDEGKEMGFFPTMVPVPLSNTMVGNLGTGLFFIGLICLFSFAVYVLTYVSKYSYFENILSQFFYKLDFQTWNVKSYFQKHYTNQLFVNSTFKISHKPTFKHGIKKYSANF